MDNESEIFVKEFYSKLEESISALPKDIKEELYRPCAENCVKKFVLKEQQRQFEECGKNLDLQYEKYGNTEYFFADIIERGHIYEIGYPTCVCVCPMVAAGVAASVAHCECSKQSILCVMKTLLPDKNIKIEMLHSVLTGANECRFRVVIE